MNYCRTNKSFVDYCDDDDIWRHILIKQYPYLKSKQITSWKVYGLTHLTKGVSDDLIGYIDLNNNIYLSNGIIDIIVNTKILDDYFTETNIDDIIFIEYEPLSYTYVLKILYIYQSKTFKIIK